MIYFFSHVNTDPNSNFKNMALDTSKIKQLPLKETEYFKEIFNKTQIVLHHTAGNASAVNTVNAWNNDTRGRIATFCAISGAGATNTKDGEIVQAFSSKYWAYHLGIKGEVFAARGLKHRILDKTSIGIEICNWGPLDPEDGKFITYVGTEVKPADVCTLEEPYKGFKYWHKYTDAQINSLVDLLKYLSEAYNIPLKYNYDRLFTVNNEALTGVPGVYTHNSYRKDKTDIYPDPRIILALKTL